MLSDAAARTLLVLHTGLGVAAVAAGTHLVVWLRKYLRGQAGKRRSVLRFAGWFLALQVAAFAAGNLMYPTYKVEVRAAFLENADEVGRAAAVHDDKLAGLAAREGVESEAPTATAALVRRAAKAAKWFDVKEHWIALGILASAAVVLILALWDPHAADDAAARAVGPLVFWLATLACATTWLGAIIGVLTAAWRAV